MHRRHGDVQGLVADEAGGVMQSDAVTMETAAAEWPGSIAPKPEPGPAGVLGCHHFRHQHQRIRQANPPTRAAAAITFAAWLLHGSDMRNVYQFKCAGKRTEES